MKRLFITLALFIVTFASQAQNVEIPDEISLITPEDFKNSEDLLLQSIEWLNETPIDKQTKKRKEINGFVMRWLTESPSVSIEVKEGLAPLGCPDCLMAFLTGWTKYSLENNYSKNKVNCALAGIENSIELYTKNKDVIGKNSEIEKLIKKQRKGKLRDFVESKF